jgi:uncharacterized protein (DUF433 family)
MVAKTKIPKLLGKGIYTPAEAARLVELTSSRVRRWIRGYRFQYQTKAGRKHGASGPVVHSDLPRIRGLMALSFLELVEVFVVSAFLKRGISMRTIRLARRHAIRRFGTPHPFASRKFKTDGRGVFVELREQTNGDKLLMELSQLQYEMPEIWEDYLERVEFDEASDLATQWWPMGRKIPIVLDPRVAFGAPTIAGTRIPVHVVGEAFRAGESVRALCFWYNLAPQKVEAAIDFYSSRRAA